MAEKGKGKYAGSQYLMELCAERGETITDDTGRVWTPMEALDALHYRRAGMSQEQMVAFLDRKRDRIARNVCSVCRAGYGAIEHKCTGVSE